jgi:hypothetical protein
MAEVILYLVSDKKPVFQFKDGILVKEWSSVIEIVDAHQELHANHISNCCRGIRKTHGGFSWAYKNEVDVIVYRKHESKNNKEDGNITRDRKMATKLGLTYTKFKEYQAVKGRLIKWSAFLANKKDKTV